MPKELPSPEMLRKLLRYEPETGKLFWRERTPDLFEDGKRSAAQRCVNFNSRLAGKEAFTADCGDGYRAGRIFGKKYRAHRVIWALAKGAWPTHEIDHTNGIRDDNRILQLRAVTCKENSKNRKTRSDNSSGHVGVSWHKVTNKWSAQISDAGKQIHLGLFTRKEDAIAARKAAEKQYGYHKNHGRG